MSSQPLEQPTQEHGGEELSTARIIEIVRKLELTA